VVEIAAGPGRLQDRRISHTTEFLISGAAGKLDRIARVLERSYGAIVTHERDDDAGLWYAGCTLSGDIGFAPVLEALVFLDSVAHLHLLRIEGGVIELRSRIVAGIPPQNALVRMESALTQYGNNPHAWLTTAAPSDESPCKALVDRMAARLTPHPLLTQNA